MSEDVIRPRRFDTLRGLSDAELINEARALAGETRLYLNTNHGDRPYVRAVRSLLASVEALRERLEREQTNG